MSDHSISLVPRQSGYPGNKAKATEIVGWLVSEDIIKPTRTHCILSADTGYAISNGAKEITMHPEYLPFALSTNGLEIITERQVFDTGGNFIDALICPACNENIAFDDWDLTPWSNNKSDQLNCTRCTKAAEIHQYTFAPEWGFSDLGFTFWNWPDFTDSFIDAFKKKLNCAVSVVRQHI